MAEGSLEFYEFQAADPAAPPSVIGCRSVSALSSLQGSRSQVESGIWCSKLCSSLQ